MYNIIIIEDTSFIRVRMCAALQQNPSYNVLVFDSADSIAANPQFYLNDIDLIITDLSLPGMDGIALTRVLHAHGKYRNIPVIIMSTDPEITTINQAIMAGAVDYIVKPIDDQLLLNKVKGVFEKRKVGPDKHLVFAGDRIKKIMMMELERARRGKTYLSIMKLEARAFYVDLCTQEIAEKMRKIDTVFGLESGVIVIMPLTDPKGIPAVLLKLRKTLVRYNMRILEKNILTYIPDEESNKLFEARMKELVE